ncbi:MAG: hypothetical protein JWP44_4384 [Mucilaginibacter sp.]|nr:hypothetical protein [Mucilaginibacter sp.]
MKSLLALACLLACSFAHAATIELPNPTARQVLNVQCGYPSPTPIAAGFSQPGDYVVAVFYGTDSCSLGGRAHMVKRYYGCAVVRWDLTGLMIDVVQFQPDPGHSCAVPPNTLYPAPQGYAASVGLNVWNSWHVFLDTP